MTDASNIVSATRTRLGWVCALCALVCAEQTLAADALHYQGGYGFDVQFDESRLLIQTDGSVSAVELAITLASEGIATELGEVGNTGTLFEVAVDGDPADVVQDIQALAGVVEAAPVVRFRENGKPFGVSERIIVKFGSSRSDAELDDFAQAYNLELMKDLTDSINLQGIYVFKVLGEDVLDRVSALHADSELVDWKASADLMSPIQLTQEGGVVINDPLFDEQWHLENTGQSGGLNDADIDALIAWDEGPGAGLGLGVVVGMYDSGCEINHPDLQANFGGSSLNVITDGEVPLDVVPHGTMVMGLMAAVNNAIGVRGVAPEAKYIATGPVVGSGSFSAKAFNYAVQQGVDVHNNSWGLPFGDIPDVLREAIENAANQGREGKGMVIVFAAGNRGIELGPGDDLATLPEVIQVGATGQGDTIASYSDYGITQDVMGPSLGDDNVGIVTTDITGDDGLNDGADPRELVGQPDYTRRFSGTSAASPIVAGSAALVVASNDELNRIQVREILTHTADKVSPRDADYDATSGFSLRYGYGRVNAGSAVQAAEASKASLNSTWPGVPQLQSLNLVGGADELLAFFEWQPTGMLPEEEDEPIEETDEAGVLIAYLQNAGEGDQIQWRPTDGETYDPGALDDVDDGVHPDPDNSDLVIIYSGPPEEISEPFGEEGQRPTRKILGLLISGEDETENQLFAMYAFNDDALYSFGVVFDQTGEIQTPESGQGGGTFPIPPDTGTPIPPDQIVETPGLNDPPSVSATANVMLGAAPLTVEFHGNAVTPREVTDRGWSFGDGAASGQNSVSHTYQQPGTFNAVYFAQDEQGDVSTRMLQIRVLDDGDDGSGSDGDSVTASAEIRVLTTGTPQAPNALVRFTVDTEGLGNSPGSVLQYAWAFGDGQSGSGQSTENIYANSGFYVVVATVTETRSNGEVLTVSASDIIEVAGDPTSSPPQSAPPAQSSDDSQNGDATQACGMMGPAMLAFLCLGLIGLRTRRRFMCRR